MDKHQLHQGHKHKKHHEKKHKHHHVKHKFQAALNGPVNSQPAGPLSLNQLNDHVKHSIEFNDPSKVHWSCIDGRDSEGVFGTPGGDLSELLMGFGVLERQVGRALTEQEVKSAFNNFMVTISPERGFYAHTDEHAVNHLLGALGWSADTDIRHLNAEQQAKALPLLTQGPNNGCGHFKFALTFSQQYQLSDTLPVFYAHAFYNYMWNGEHPEKIAYTILRGDHNEQAVLVVDKIEGSFPDNAAPLLAPDATGNSVFVYHAGLVHQGIRNRVAAFISAQAQAAFNLSVSTEEVVRLIDEVARVQLTETVKRLAPTKPMYTVSIHCGKKEELLL